MRNKFLFSNFSREIIPILATMGTALVLESCESSIQPSEVTESTPQTLSATSHSVAYLNGEYQNCKTHLDGDLWSAKITAWSGSIVRPYDLLQVVEHDNNCSLFLKDVIFSDVSGSVATTYTLSPEVEIKDTFLATQIPFFLPPTAQPQFFGNIRLVQPNANPNLRFDGAFGLSFVYAADPNLTSIPNGPISYLSVGTSQVSISLVLAPDYAQADFATDGFFIAEDSFSKIIDLGGDLRLTATLQQGEHWVFAPDGIVTAGLGPGNSNNYNDVALSYTHAVVDNHQPERSIAFGATAGAHPMKVKPSEIGFALGDIVSSIVTKTLIVKHTESAADTYEVIFITFIPPSPPIIVN